MINTQTAKQKKRASPVSLLTTRPLLHRTQQTNKGKKRRSYKNKGIIVKQARKPLPFSSLEQLSSHVSLPHHLFSLPTFCDNRIQTQPSLDVPALCMGSNEQ
jgi:hypothetical protein